MRSYGRSLPRVIHVSLGTNDDPRASAGFRAAIREVMAVAGAAPLRRLDEHRAPAVPGHELRGLQPGARARSRAARENLRVVNWARLVRRAPASWLVDDGVHVTPTGYRAAGEGGRPRRAALQMRAARLYVTAMSNPSRPPIAMVALKRLPHRVVTLLGGPTRPGARRRLPRPDRAGARAGRAPRAGLARDIARARRADRRAPAVPAPTGSAPRGRGRRALGRRRCCRPCRGASFRCAALQRPLAAALDRGATSRLPAPRRSRRAARAAGGAPLAGSAPTTRSGRRRAAAGPARPRRRPGGRARSAPRSRTPPTSRSSPAFARCSTSRRSPEFEQRPARSGAEALPALGGRDALLRHPGAHPG